MSRRLFIVAFSRFSKKWQNSSAVILLTVPGPSAHGQLERVGRFSQKNRLDPPKKEDLGNGSFFLLLLEVTDKFEFTSYTISQCSHKHHL